MALAWPRPHQLRLATWLSRQLPHHLHLLPLGMHAAGDPTDLSNKTLEPFGTLPNIGWVSCAGHKSRRSPFGSPASVHLAAPLRMHLRPSCVATWKPTWMHCTLAHPCVSMWQPCHLAIDLVIALPTCAMPFGMCSTLTCHAPTPCAPAPRTLVHPAPSGARPRVRSLQSLRVALARATSPIGSRQPMHTPTLVVTLDPN